MDWLPARCYYGNLCAAILRACYNQTSLRAGRTQRRCVLDLQSQLEDWVRSLPGEIQTTIHLQNDFSTIIDPKTLSDMESSASAQQRRNAMLVFFQYHEAAMAIHTIRHPAGLHSATESSGTTLTTLSTHSADDSENATISSSPQTRSARKLLAASCHISASHVRSYPFLYRLVCVAACTLGAETIRSSGFGDRRDLPYLATAAGFVGRMVLAGIEGPLEEITEVVRMAQQSIREKQRHERIIL